MEDANKRLSDLVNTIQTADLSELPEPEKTIVGKALAFAKSVISDTTLSGNDIVIVNNAISMMEDAVAQIAMIPGSGSALFCRLRRSRYVYLERRR